MKLILITGFLGSGKTSFIINIARSVVSAGQRIAILVNEIGEIGIDNQLMRQLDLDVWELMNGCICCTLSGDLVTTLQKLDESYQPDIVLVEPSGAAEPGNILNALPYYQGRPLEKIKTITLVDPLRIVPLYTVMSPLITKQIEKANLAVITKADQATPQEIADARRIIDEINPDVEFVTLSAKEPLDPALVEKVIS